MKLLFLLAGLLLATSTLASSNTDASSSTAGLSSSTGGTDATSTGATEGSSASPGSTVSSGPSDSPGTTVSGATDLPSSPGASTQGGSTVSQGPTTTAPLPNVTYSLLQFGAPVCVDLTCTYTINAPGNNQAVLATDQSIIGGDRTQFNALQSSANAADANVKKANDAAAAKIKELQSLLDQIQGNLNFIQNATKTIQTQQNDAAATLIFVERFISGIQSEPSTCLYQRCLKPTTPAPPTTTTAPPPTTSPSPCANFTCPADPAGTCQLDSSNKAYCPNCIWNWDGYNHCDSVACSASGTNFTLDANGNGTWLSTGYNKSDSSSSVIPANSNCVWNLPSVTFQLSTGTTDPPFTLKCLASQTVTIRFTSADGSFYQEIASTTSVRSLNNLLPKVKGGTITLTSTVAEPSFCSIPLTTVPGSSSEEIEIPELVETKKNGFFSWLMGY
uniref:CUB domain-containing protein n=1 Tax=Caenorhabditis tropicalis TaxID=1561998 RepID=A0A1I7U8V6_9PELO